VRTGNGLIAQQVRARA